MSKIIKVIELLNKISKGEEVPEKIEYKNFEYIYSSEIGWYRRINHAGMCDEWFIDKNRLNDGVKIIEEKPEIDIQGIKEFDEIRDLSVWSNDTLSKNQREIVPKINQLIRAVKQLDKRINGDKTSDK